MRLTSQELQAVRNTLYGADPEGRVWLFGSRADDTRRGADIDVYLEASRAIDLKAALKLEYRLMSLCGSKVGLNALPPTKPCTFTGKVKRVMKWASSVLTPQPGFNCLNIDFQRLVDKLVEKSQRSPSMNIEVGSYEAKTKLPELLRGVQVGNRYTITLRGEAVADLVPAGGTKSSDAAAAVDEMLTFMRARKPVSSVDLKAFIDDGRA